MEAVWFTWTKTQTFVQDFKKGKKDFRINHYGFANLNYIDYLRRENISSTEINQNCNDS